MKDQRKQHEDLEALLSGIPPEEAERLRAVWALTEGEPGEATPPEEVDAAVRRLHGALGFAEAAPARSHVRLLRHPAWAAVAAAVVVCAVGLWLWMRPVVHTAAPGAPLALVLPDGSNVELNSGSSLRYARRFDDVRAVALEGEAFFDVVTDAQPFVVETHDARVRVLGTRFAVRAWRGGLEGGTTVALEEGRVALAPAADPERSVTLVPGDTRRVDDEAPHPATVADAMAWRSGGFVFKDQHVGVVVADVERRYGIDLQIRPLSLEQLRISMVLRQPAGAEAVVRDLAGVLGLRYRPTSNGFELYEEQ